jgi:hypothetical protein
VWLRTAARRLTSAGWVGREILKTEESYVAGLRSLIDDYLCPLRAELGGKAPVLTAEELRLVFGDLEVQACPARGACGRHLALTAAPRQHGALWRCGVDAWGVDARHSYN